MIITLLRSEQNNAFLRVVVRKCRKEVCLFYKICERNSRCVTFVDLPDIVVSARIVAMRGTHPRRGLRGGLRVEAGVAVEAELGGSGVAAVHPTPALTIPR